MSELKGSEDQHQNEISQCLKEKHKDEVFDKYNKDFEENEIFEEEI